MDIHMVAMDLDNTLLRRDKTISPYTVSILNTLQAEGVLLAYATSRSANASRRFRQDIKPNINITSCGALATLGKEVLYRRAIPIMTATPLLKELSACPGIAEITADTEHRYYSSLPLDKDWEGKIDFLDTRVVDFSRPLPEADVFRIILNAANETPIRAIARKYPELDLISFTGESWHQIKAKTAAKELALAAVCNRLRIDPKKVVAFGDDYSDVGMLRFCGWGVAMDNAIPECKTAAAYSCGDCDEDGVAKWLEANFHL